MGCTSSKLADPATDDHPAALLSRRLDEIGNARELQWTYQPTWGLYMAYLYSQARSAGSSTKSLRANLEQLVNLAALEFLKWEYPECAAAGTTEDLHHDEGPYGSGARSAAVVRTKLWATLDEGRNGIVYAYTLVVHDPAMAWRSVADADGAGRPARIAESPQVRLAQRYASSIVGTMDKQGANMRHAVINVVVGAVMLSAIYEPRNLTPSLALISQNDGPELLRPAGDDDGEKAQEEEEEEEEEEGRGGHPQRRFRAHLFMAVLATLEADYPGCTVWDAGAMPFAVDGQPHPHPARLLVCRDYAKRIQDVDTLDFKVQRPGDASAVATIVRARDPAAQEEPGGVACLAVVVAVDPTDPWPRRDPERHRAVAAAALRHAAKHAVLVALLRGFDSRCALRVWVGQDARRYTLLAPLAKGSTAEHAREFAGLVFGAPVDPPLRPPRDPADPADLEAEFGVAVARKQAHRLWASESHFRSVRHAMKERAKADPELYEKIAVLAGHEGAATFLARNFEGAVVADEGPLPQNKGGGVRLENTKVLVARDPRQDPSSVVAVLVAAPCPVPGRSAMSAAVGSTWLGTPEMKGAEEAVLALLKKWHGQGKVSTADCFVQVMMGVDASIYQFVDGDKFVDYPEERIKHLRWQ